MAELYNGIPLRPKKKLLDSGYKMDIPYISIMTKAKHKSYSMGQLYEVSKEGRFMETGSTAGLQGLLNGCFLFCFCFCSSLSEE